MKFTYKNILQVLLLMIILAACSGQMGEQSTAIPSASTQPPDANAVEATPTPTSPAVDGTPLPSSTPLPPGATEGPIWGAYPSPQITPATTQLPYPAVRLEQPKKMVNILLMGADEAADRVGSRTDIMILVTLRPDGTVAMTSFPRDIYVYIPGWKMERLNAAQGHGGFECTAQTFEYNFGVRPDYYAFVNMEGFKIVVNKLDGIYVDVAKTFYAPRDGYPDGYTYYAGRNFMYGDDAIWYSSSRATSSDVDRTRRAQEVIVGIAHRVLEKDGLKKIPELYKTYKAYVKTDLTLFKILSLVPRYKDLDLSTVERYNLGEDALDTWIQEGSGAFYFIPKPASVEAVLRKAFGEE